MITHGHEDHAGSAAALRTWGDVPAVLPCPVDVELGDGDTVGFGGGARVVATPGHTDGSIAVALPGHGEDLNTAVKELAGEEYTCKDLRTWNAMVLAAVTLAAGTARGGVPRSERTRKRVVKQVTEHLGNTPAVARASYIDPRVLERYTAGCTMLPAVRRLDGPMPDLTDGATRAQVERAVVRLITS